MVDKLVIQNAIAFLQRTELKGSEVEAYVAVSNALNAMLKDLDVQDNVK